MEHILDHPMIKHKISILRNEKTSTKEFRELISEIAMLLCYKALSDAKTYKEQIKTPITTTVGEKVNENDYAFVPILRAGMGMVDGVLKLMPNAKIGHIGLYRNEETLEPVKYYCKLPKNIQDKEVILLDPMLATGGSGSAAITMLKKDGVKKIKFLCIIALIFTININLFKLIKCRLILCCTEFMNFVIISWSLVSKLITWEI